MNPAVLNIGVVIDNSPSMSEEKLDALTKGFESIFDEFKNEIIKQSLQITVVSFDRFSPKVIKDYEETTFNSTIESNRFPLIGRSLTFVAEHMLKQLQKSSTEVHTPWLIVMSNGLSLDSIRSSHPSLMAIKNKHNLRYLPFLTTREKIASRSIEQEQFDNKKPMVILDQRIEMFFVWLKEDIRNRLSTPINERVTSDKKLLEGWTIL